MASTYKTEYYELSQYIGTDKPTYLVDYNNDMSIIDNAIHTNKTNIETNANDITNIAGDVSSISNRLTTAEGNISNNSIDIDGIETTLSNLSTKVDELEEYTSTKVIGSFGDKTVYRTYVNTGSFTVGQDKTINLDINDDNKLFYVVNIYGGLEMTGYPKSFVPINFYQKSDGSTFTCYYLDSKLWLHSDYSTSNSYIWIEYMKNN